MDGFDRPRDLASVSKTGEKECREYQNGCKPAHRVSRRAAESSAPKKPKKYKPIRAPVCDVCGMAKIGYLFGLTYLHWFSTSRCCCTLTDRDFILSLAVLHPPFYLLSSSRSFLICPLTNQFSTDFGLCPRFSCEPPDLRVRVADEGYSLLVLPAQVGNVLHCDGDEHPTCRDSHGEGEGRSEEDAAVSGDDAAGHCRD
jgi:hypothetical protein